MDPPAGLENQVQANDPVPRSTSEENTSEKHDLSTTPAIDETNLTVDSQAQEADVFPGGEDQIQEPTLLSVEDDDDSDWTDESLMEAHIGVIEDEEYSSASGERCSLEESKQLRKMLREVGPEEFVRETLESENYTARKLCTAFGAVFDDVEFLSAANDDVFLPLLGALMKKELMRRYRLEQYTNIDHAANLLQQCKNVVIITGAGISTNLGIPDFRSKGTGLYSRLEHLGLSDAQEVFDIALFHEDPSIFYSVAKDIVPATKRFSPTHAFIRLLQDKNKLLTNFTQNIDNLEEAAGIDREKLIQCHGSFATATCQKCGFKCPGDQIADNLKAGQVPQCPACLRSIRQLQPLGLKRKQSYTSTSSNKKPRRDFDRSSESDEDEDGLDAPGVMKPDITFFGEDLPKTFHDRLMDHDRDLVDLVIVIGTSLKVSPVADIPNFLPPNVPQIYISRDPVKHIQFDIELLGDCDQIVTELCRRAGWDFKHEMVPDGQILEAHPYENSTTRWQMLPAEGSATTKREAIDSGTLGHGSALSPTQKRPDHDIGKIPPDASHSSLPLLPAFGSQSTATGVPPVTYDGSADTPSQSDGPEHMRGKFKGKDVVTNGAAFEEDDDIGDSITLTPRSTGTPAPNSDDV